MRVIVGVTAPNPLLREVQLQVVVGLSMTVRSGRCSLFVAVLKRLFFGSSVHMCRTVFCVVCLSYCRAHAARGALLRFSRSSTKRSVQVGVLVVVPVYPATPFIVRNDIQCYNAWGVGGGWGVYENHRH